MNNTNYEDIINLPHHVSKKHPQMSLEARSAQFAPFAALTGFEDIIEETARITDEKLDINEELKVILDNKLKNIINNISNRPKIICTYFIPDEKKNGGSYKTIQEKVKKIDEIEQKIIFENGTEISIANIIEIEIEKN